jgi:hypothetical protein
MADADPGTGGPLPAYFVAWRDAWGPQAADWTPVHYLNQQAALPAGTLFHPATTEYRGVPGVHGGLAVRAVSRRALPDRVVRVEVHDGSDPADYGPAVTFWTEPVAGPASGAVTG